MRGSADDAVTARKRMRALAADFPGALREIDVLTAAQIEERVGALERVARGDALPEWARWLDRYHAWLRVALHVRAQPLEERATSVVAVMERERVFAEGALDAIKAPPRGRLTEWASALVAREFGVDIANVKVIVAPRINPS